MSRGALTKLRQDAVGSFGVDANQQGMWTYGEAVDQLGDQS